jgi:hypothetical protein
MDSLSGLVAFGCSEEGEAGGQFKGRGQHRDMCSQRRGMERTSRELRKPVQKEHSEKRFRKGSLPCSPCAHAQLMQYSVSKSTCASRSGVCSRCATAFCSYSSGSHVFMDVRSAVCNMTSGHWQLHLLQALEYVTCLNDIARGGARCGILLTCFASSLRYARASSTNVRDQSVLRNSITPVSSPALHIPTIQARVTTLQKPTYGSKPCPAGNRQGA